MSIRLSASTAQSLLTDGYCRFKVDDIAPSPDTESGLGRLQAAVDNLPIDPYAPAANRYRRYSNGILLPWARRVEWMPNRQGPKGEFSEYYQSDYNPEYVSQTRHFMPFEAQLIRPFVVGVHLVKLLVPKAGDRAVSSPDVLHQDGEPFTFVHLVKRENAVGARTAVAIPDVAGKKPEEVDPATIHTQFELLRPLDSYGVLDSKVAHYVSGLERGPEDRPGVRAALLTDFTPLVPLI